MSIKPYYSTQLDTSGLPGGDGLNEHEIDICNAVALIFLWVFGLGLYALLHYVEVMLNG